MTLQGYTHDLKAVRRCLGGKKLQQLTKADGDALVEWMLTKGRTSPRRFRRDSLAAHVIEMIAQHPTGITAAELSSAFPTATYAPASRACKGPSGSAACIGASTS